MKIYKWLVLFFLSITFFTGLAAEPADKPAFDLPDVVIKAKDRSQSDWLQKTDINQPEIPYKKEVPTSRKVAPDILVSEQKSKPAPAVKKGIPVINQFQLGIGNLHLLRYQFTHGQTQPDHHVLLSLSRDLTGDYIPFSYAHYDHLAADYVYTLSTSEKLSFSTHLERQQRACPSANNGTRGTITPAFLPVKVSYLKDLTPNEKIQGELLIENLDVTVPDQQAQNLFTIGAGGTYTNRDFHSFDLFAEAKLNNNVSLAGARITYPSPEATTPVQGNLGLYLYQSFLPGIINDSFLAIRGNLRYDFSPNTFIRVEYAPQMEELPLTTLYLDSPYTEINNDLQPQINTSWWQAEFNQQLSSQFRWQTQIGFGRSKNLMAYADSDQDGFIEPTNVGWGDRFWLRLQGHYVITTDWSLKAVFDHHNTRLSSGRQLPGDVQNTVELAAHYANPRDDLKGSVSVKYHSNRVDILDTSRQLPGVMTVGLEGTKRITKTMKVNARIENLFNGIIYTRSDFYEPRMSVEVGGEVDF